MVKGAGTNRRLQRTAAIRAVLVENGMEETTVRSDGGCTNLTKLFGFDPERVAELEGLLRGLTGVVAVCRTTFREHAALEVTWCE